MKPKSAILTTYDRVATWEEIRRATFYTPDRVLELCCRQGPNCEFDSETGGIIRYPAEEFEFFVQLSEMQNSSVN